VRSAIGTPESCAACEVVVASILGVTPHSVLEDLIPHVAATGSSQSWVTPHTRWVDSCWVFGVRHRPPNMYFYGSV
jgi:hypothetical protein